MMDQKTKAHPDYEAGYGDGFNGRAKGKISAQYHSGWEAGEFARSVFLKAGFTQDREDSFSVSFPLPKDDGK